MTSVKLPGLLEFKGTSDGEASTTRTRHRVN